MREVTSFCRICEPMCGLVAKVDGDRVVSVRGDRDHRFSQGFACIKAAALVHPADAAAAGLADGDEAAIVSSSGRIVIRVRSTDEVSPGTVAIPHCWGHDGGWSRANAAGGACSNLLASAEATDIESLAGMSVLNGIPVRLSSSEREL